MLMLDRLGCCHAPAYERLLPGESGMVNPSVECPGDDRFPDCLVERPGGVEGPYDTALPSYPGPGLSWL